MKTTSITEYPLPDSLSTEIQVLADIISLPQTMMEAQRIVTSDMFSNDVCRQSWETLASMSKQGVIIDLPSAYNRLDKEFVQKGVLPMMQNTAGDASAIQHYALLKDLYIKRKCYFAALDFLMASCDSNKTGNDLIGKVGGIAESLRKEVDAEKDTQHISTVLNDLGEQIEENIRNKEEGKVLRVPTGFSMLDFFTYGGFNAGNLVILAARPSVGKTAIMLQMARAAARSNKTVNLFNLEMTNTELAQRFLFSTEIVSPIQMAKGDIKWTDFEIASSYFADKPIYLNDSASSIDEIVSRITINSQLGKCDIAFIDYLGLINMGNSRAPLTQQLAETTKRLKTLAKSCRIPIVLLCQLNRASATEKRPPALHDLRDSGSIEQDADIVLMLERSATDEEGRDVNIWVRKNRQGRAGELKIEITANDTFTSFTEKNGRYPEPVYREGPLSYNDFDNDSDIPF